MLVITRKAGDRVQIGDDITVTLLEITGSSVRLGIDAPAEVAVYRHEILEAVKEENRAAAEAGAELPSGQSDLPPHPTSS
jgi:carbon storage regulator